MSQAYGKLLFLEGTTFRHYFICASHRVFCEIMPRSPLIMCDSTHENEPIGSEVNFDSLRFPKMAVLSNQFWYKTVLKSVIVFSS